MFLFHFYTLFSAFIISTCALIVVIIGCFKLKISLRVYPKLSLSIMDICVGKAWLKRLVGQNPLPVTISSVSIRSIELIWPPTVSNIS